MVSRPAILFVALLALSCLSFAQMPSAQMPGSAWPTPGMDASGRPDGRNAERSSLVGTVHTVDNHPIANARVEVRDVAYASGSASTYTSPSGDFELDNLPAGNYEVSVYSGLAEAHERVQVQSSRAYIEVRMQSSTSTTAEAGGSNTVSVNQFQVPGKARDAFRKAQQYADSLKLEDAGKYVEKALAIYPRYAKAMALRGILKLDANNPDAATADLEQALQFDSGYSVAYIALGAAYNMLSRFDDAVRAIDRGIALSPNSWQAYFEMGKAYIGKGDFEDAVKQLNKAEDLAPKKFALVHLLKAHALLGMKDYANAMMELEAYLTRDPSGPNSDQARQALERVRAFAAVSTK